jgi:hypothetical protein
MNEVSRNIITPLDFKGLGIPQPSRLKPLLLAIFSATTINSAQET